MSDGEPQFDELGQLADLLCDGEITSAQAARLEELVKASPAARRFFRNYLQLHAELHWELAAGRKARVEVMAPRRPAHSEGNWPSPASRRRRRIFLWTNLALLVAALGILAAGLALLNRVRVQRLSTRAAVPLSESAVLPPQPLRPSRAPVAVAPSIAAMRGLVAADPRLIHHYPFEGQTPAEKCRDRRGQLDLGEAVMFAGRGDGGVDYTIPGFDSSSNAVRTFRATWAGDSTGVGLQSQAAFDPPRSLTVELLLRDAGITQTGAICAALATRADDRRCSFFITAVDKGHVVHLMDADSPWVEAELGLAPGDWYYLAATFASEGNSTRINTYACNLSRGQRSLNRVVRDALTAGTPSASRMGIGKAFNQDTAHAYPWAGELDEVAIYAGAIDEATLQQHLSAMLPDRSESASPAAFPLP